MQAPTQVPHGEPYQVPHQDPTRASYQTSFQAPNGNPSQSPIHISYQVSYQDPSQPPYPGPYQGSHPPQNFPPNHAPGSALNQRPQQPPTGQQNYYKPLATTKFVLCLFVLASLIFLAGLEVVLQRGIPVPLHVTSSNSTSSKIQRRVLGGPTSTYSENWTSYEKTPSYTKPAGSMPSCIGIEIIVSITTVDQCSTVASGPNASCAPTTAQSTYQSPIFNTPIPTMPCYICAMEEQGIETSGWITATTTRCASCGSQSPATIYPCSTCEGTVLSATPLWETTPTWSAQAHTTYGKHTHGEKKAPRPTGPPAA